MAEQSPLNVPQQKKILYNRGEKEKLEELEAYKPHDLAEKWPHESPCSPSNAFLVEHVTIA
jgi:hypothetical protein